MIQRESENVILNYLFKRQNLVMQKFEEFIEKSMSTFNNQQQTMYTLDMHVKGLIESQQSQMLRRQARDNRRNPHTFNENEPSNMRIGYDEEDIKSKAELLQIY